MPGIWRNNPETPEGKFPIVLRRDGKPVEDRYMVLLLKDPGTAHALRAYAAEHGKRGTDPVFVRDVLNLSEEAKAESRALAKNVLVRQSDPAASPHRTEDQAVLCWARSVGCPGS